MVQTADSLWEKYFQNKPKPKDSLELVQAVIDAISLQHAQGRGFFRFT